LAVKQYPLIASLKKALQGRSSFIAVDARAWLLVTEHEGEFLAEGVQPGGIAAEGSTLREAYAAFMVELEGAILELLVRSVGPQDFENALVRFFAEVNEPALGEFHAARALVAAGRLALDDAPTIQAETNRPAVELTFDLVPRVEANSLPELLPPIAA
jgi:hypothetical protein